MPSVVPGVVPMRTLEARWRHCSWTLLGDHIVPARWNFFPSIGKHLPNVLEGGTVAFTIFGGKPISVFSRHVVPPAFLPRHNAGTMEAR